MLCRPLLTLALALSVLVAKAQDSLPNLPADYIEKVTAKAGAFEQKLDKKTDKVLDQMMKQEEKMKNKLAKIDSSKAQEVFGDVQQKYRDIKERLTKLPGKQYIPSLDTLSTSLKFLQQNPQLVSQVKDGEQKLKDAMGKVNGLEGKFQQAEEIKKFLKERKQFLKERLSQFGFARQLKKLNKQAYYYAAQVNEYKELLKDEKKAERKAIELLSKTKLFQDFMRKNSMLASLFRMPGEDLSDPAVQASLAGLQTRAQVNNLIQQQITAGGPNEMNQFRQNMQEAQSQLNNIRNKISKFGGGSSDMEMPEGFKPNNQKTKSFWKRIDVGINTQSQKANDYFPNTSDLGLSLGYKLNDKSIIGVAASYKVGLGRGWNHIKFSSEGAGLRSFIDLKIRSPFGGDGGGLWISGGYEANYKTAFNKIDELKNFSAWQQSGLLGISKVLSIKTRFFKKTKLQLLWDFMSYQQVPRTQPIVFRIGYSLK
jgi:hypothetical protein